MVDKQTNLNKSDHPLRVMARRIIDEVVEIHIGSFFTREQSKRMEDDIVALLTNL